MDEKTLDYYSQNAPDVFKRYDSVQGALKRDGFRKILFR